MMLFQGKDCVFKNTFDLRPGKMNSNLKWTELPERLYIDKGGAKVKFEFKEDWSKTIHLYNDKFFVTGGSMEERHQ